MSHELRTPLGIILGYLEMLLDGAVGELAPPQKDILKKLDRNSRALFELMSMVLDVNRLQAGGQLPLEVRKVQVAELLAEVQAELQGLCEQSRLSCLWRVAADLPPLYTDPGKLKVVIKNLVNNAVKFTSEGSITITAAEQCGGVQIRVTDTGIGIPVEVQSFMFEPFRQAESSMTRRYSGSGLGLYIVKHFLAMLGGSVTVESEVGRGSTFCVWLPARIGER
jgi:signal transduction histidine kinase